VARRYGLHPSQVFAWRKAAREGNIEEAGGGFDSAFTPVLVTGGSPMPPSGALGYGRMEIELLSGRRIVVDAGVDAAALDRVVNVLERR
jgi:transposase